MITLLLAAIAWAVASEGATSLRDLMIVLALLVAAAAVGRAPRLGIPVWISLGALLAWLLVEGPIRSGLSLETVRVPLLVVAAALTATVVGQLSPRDRRMLLDGMIVVGALQAVIALAQFAVSVGTSSPVRSAGTLGSPDGLGMLLVATSILTARSLILRGGPLLAAALLVQGAAILATGSRAAILCATIPAVWFAVRRAGWRGRALIIAAAVGGLAIVGRRTLTEPQSRPLIWQEALHRIAQHPLIGEGSGAILYAPGIPGSRVTTHAHDEALQWAVEYGLVGIALGVVVLLLAVRSSHRAGLPDRAVQAAAAAIMAAGLTDYSLRITAITVIAAALATLALQGVGSPGLREPAPDQAGRCRPRPIRSSSAIDTDHHLPTHSDLDRRQ